MASIQDRLQYLGDLELALLVSLVAEEHCICSTDADSTKLLRDELRLTCIETFGLLPVLIECSHQTTVDEFNDAVLVEVEDTFEDAVDHRDKLDRPMFQSISSSRQGRSPSRFGSLSHNLDDRRVADVIIVTGLDLAAEGVQVQALELIRSRRIFTRSAMHTAPKDLLFVTVLSRPRARLSHHLNDLFAISHFHPKEDGLPHAEGNLSKNSLSTFAHEDIQHLRELMSQITITAELAQYIHNVVVFMRNSRYVKGGVTATATRQLRTVSRALAPLHGLDYIPPSLVALAARKIYPHRLVLATPENEKSLQWGSDPSAVRDLLDGVTVEDVIEDVLADIEAPL